MDFVSGLPLSLRKKDAIWVIVDILTKSAHFVPVRTDYSLDKLAELYISEIVRLHGVPLSIVPNREPRFTLRFWKKLQEALGTKLHFSTVVTVQLVEDVHYGKNMDSIDQSYKETPLEILEVQKTDMKPIESSMGLPHMKEVGCASDLRGKVVMQTR
ncbi:integrase [Gossypium australe]|uniref:Integrase n=1 Tax=Gossypium australe TaxID=47621 RepID=A0A5B6VXL5_9ROSI|nr:integrase [Gossypium australe]